MSFKETEIGKIPIEWKYDSIKNSLYIKGRIGWKGLKKSEYLEESEYRIINGSNVVDNKVDWKGCGYISEERYLESPEIMLQKHDIIMTKDGTIGKLAVVSDLSDPTTVASGLFVIRIETNEIDVYYLFNYFRSPFFKKLIESRIEGSVIPHLYQKDLVGLKLPLPSLPEQKAIANILSTLDEKIETNNKINKTLEKMAQEVFKHWFVDFEFPNEDGDPYKSSGGEMVESELGLIPKGWEAIEIASICSIQNGFAFRATEYVDEGIKVIRTLNIGDDGFFNNEGIVFLPQTYESEKFTKYILKEFDIGLVMVGANIGKIGMILENTAGGLQNQNMWRFRTKSENVSQFFLYYAVKQAQEISKNWSTGSAREFYRKDSFSKIKVILPTNHIMERFHSIVKDSFNLISNNTSETQELKILRDTLLPKLMSGQIRVPLNNNQQKSL